MRVLIVEDEPYLADAIRDGLALDAIAADIVHDGGAALDALDLTDYDVMLLDRDLPVVHGDDVCRRVVEREERPAILMLTAARHLNERVDGFGLGADDYVTKPFEFPELVARVRALARRRQPSHGPTLRADDLRMHVLRREVSRGERQIHLTRKEFAVLEVLLRDGGTPISAEALLERAWDENANPFTNSVKVVVSNLRRKLGEPPLIRTVPGAGYLIESERGHDAR